jgi:uncharacterized protein (UPF0261 family)
VGDRASACVAVLATLDTKGPQASFVAEALRRQRVTPWLVDVGLGRSADRAPADVSCADVAAAAGTDLAAVRALPSRHQMIEAMGRGAAAVLARRLAQGGLHGILALGGNQGAAIGAIAMRDLPFGLPKLIVTTVASGNVRPYVGCKDIATLFSVADLAGAVNRVTGPVLRNAALAMAGMALSREAAPRSERPAVAVTVLGNTQAAADRAMQRLADAGYEPVAFHASGACGSAMERLVEAGDLAAVLDLTPHELAAEVMGEGVYQPVAPGRLTAAGRRGIPQVVATGALEYLCFGAPETIPPRYRGRATVRHNPMNANVRLTADELARVGEVLAERLGAARGPAAVLLPEKGWSSYGGPGGPLHDAAADAALVRALEARLPPRVPLRKLPLHVNDPEFADACADTLLSMLGSRPGAEAART